MKTILVPTDFTPLAEGALGVAVDLARTYGADILLVHYLPYSIASASTAEGAMAMSSYFGEQEDEAESALQRLIENPAYQGVSITPVATRNAGGLYAAMTQPVPNQVGVTPAGPAVRDRPERRPDLIVLGTHGTLGWDEWLF
ncbi:MAG: universal stress protein UspA, partial [Spirosoma sp.]|nr:universal stress protein UspA [Spirosoma sp.]